MEVVSTASVLLHLHEIWTPSWQKMITCNQNRSQHLPWRSFSFSRFSCKHLSCRNVSYLDSEKQTTRAEWNEANRSDRFEHVWIFMDYIKGILSSFRGAELLLNKNREEKQDAFKVTGSTPSAFSERHANFMLRHTCKHFLAFFSAILVQACQNQHEHHHGRRVFLLHPALKRHLHIYLFLYLPGYVELFCF